MTNRFEDFISLLPKGEFYKATGERLPFQDAAYSFEFRTTEADTEYRVYLNDTDTGPAYTDSTGLAIVTLAQKLEPGEYEVKIVSSATQLTYRYQIQISNIATLLHAYGQVFDDLDTKIDDIDAARSIRTVGESYIEDAYGRLVHQAFPENWLLESYRTALQRLRPAYRHFGGHKRGVKEAVATLTAINPLIVPKAWRPKVVLGDQLVPGGNLDTHTRTCSQQVAPAGASGPILDLPDLNRQSRYYVSPSVTTSASDIRALPFPQRISVTLPDANAMTVTGVDENENVITEIIPDPSITPAAGTYFSQNIFSAVTAGEKSGSAGQIGLGESRFVTITRVGDFNEPGTSVNLTYRGYDDHDRPQFVWGSGPITSVEGSSVELRDEGRYASAVGRIETATDFNVDPRGDADPTTYHDRLWLNIDGLGVIGINLNDSPPVDTVAPADAVTRAIAALDGDLRYGNGSGDYDNVPFVITGTEGDNDDVLALKSITPYDPTIPSPARIEIVSGPCDAAPFVLGLPRSTSYLTAAVSGSTLTCADTSRMPNVSSSDEAPYRRRFDIRVRGLRLAPEAGVTLVSNGANNGTANRYKRALLNLAYTFTSSDVGGYIRWEDAAVAGNSGLHKIIGISAGSAIILHETADNTGYFDFTGAVTGDAAVYHPGATYTVTNNNKTTNVLTVDGTPYAWPEAAIVEMVTETPYCARGSVGLGELTLEVDPTYRPLHDFGDSIVNVAGNTWKVVSARAVFTGLTGRPLTLSNCENEENNGTFTITALSGVGNTEAHYTNASAVAEANTTLEWSVEPVSAGIADGVTAEGVLLPDGMYLGNQSTILAQSNLVPNVDASAPGLIAKSRLLLTCDSAEEIILYTPVPRALDYIGLPLEVAYWVQEHTTDMEFIIEVSFNGTDYFEIARPTDIPSTVIENVELKGPLDPIQLAATFYVPWDAETCILRLTRNDTTGSMSLERVSVSSPTGTGLCLGDNTVMRSQKRGKFGQLLYVWSAEELSDDEEKMIGLSTDGSSSIAAVVENNVLVRQQPGHVDRITAAHAYWDRVDVSERDEDLRLNMLGVATGEDWTALSDASGLARLSVAIGTPTRTSYVFSAASSLVEAEELTPVAGGGGEGVCQLEYPSLHEGSYPQDPNTGLSTRARLYELKSDKTSMRNPDGLMTVIPAEFPIPLPDEEDEDSILPWFFSAQDEITIDAAYYEPTSSYVLDYEIMTRATTEPIELAANGIDPDDYVWMVDCSYYVRHQVEAAALSYTEEVAIRADLSGRLTYRADLEETATLIQDNGVSARYVPSTKWRFLSSREIQLDGSAFDPNSLYSITYQARTANPEPVAAVHLEWRHGVDEAALDAADWVSVENGQIVSPHFEVGDDATVNAPPAWQQVRATITGVNGPDDLKIFSIGLKGLNLFGDEAYAPGVLTPGP